MTYNSICNFITFGKMFGVRLLYCFYFKKWAWCGLPVSTRIFGKISHREELLSIRDNILTGSLLDRELEKKIRTVKKPLIVDCGVNVGVSVRWWFYLNPEATVYGIDMMQEANDFTVSELPDRFKAGYLPITAMLAASTGKVVELSYDDPLFGGNNAGAASGYSQKRSVTSKTLDDCLSGHNISSVDLLKIDIEDSAALMLEGAKRTLPKVKTILLEIHSDLEFNNASRILSENGFHIRRAYKRHIWLEKASA